MTPHRALVAVVLDCLRAPAPGEDYIDLTTTPAPEHGISGRRRAALAPKRTAQPATRNKAASKDRESLEANTPTAAPGK